MTKTGWPELTRDCAPLRQTRETPPQTNQVTPALETVYRQRVVKNQDKPEKNDIRVTNFFEKKMGGTRTVTVQQRHWSLEKGSTNKYGRIADSSFDSQSTSVPLLYFTLDPTSRL